MSSMIQGHPDIHSASGWLLCCWLPVFPPVQPHHIFLPYNPQNTENGFKYDDELAWKKKEFWKFFKILQDQEGWRGYGAEKYILDEWNNEKLKILKHKVQERKIECPADEQVLTLGVIFFCFVLFLVKLSTIHMHTCTHVCVSEREYTQVL